MRSSDIQRPPIPSPGPLPDSHRDREREIGGSHTFFALTFTLLLLLCLDSHFSLPSRRRRRRRRPPPMALPLPDNSSPRQSLLPSFLYSSSFSPFISKTLPPATSSAPAPAPLLKDSDPFPIPAPSEPPFGKIELYSPQFYTACTVGGILSCGLTHMAVTPLDLVKCNMQVPPSPPDLS